MFDVLDRQFEFCGDGEHYMIKGQDWSLIESLVKSLPDEYRSKFQALEIDVLPVVFTDRKAFSR